jgi:MOSC domain-containing protein YiiM
MIDGSTGRITDILVAVASAAPLCSVASVDAVAQRGLSGDRYFLGIGHYSGKPGWGANVTFIESEAIAAINAGYGTAISAASVRRNLVTTGIKLETLIGREFRCGRAILRGTKKYPPCQHLAYLVRNQAILRYLAYCGGIGAEVLQTGVISVNDEISEVSSA